MDTFIHETNLTIRATDSEAILTPRLLRQIVNEVVAELEQMDMYAERRQRVRRIEQGARQSDMNGA
jgi:hypothetical protein